MIHIDLDYTPTEKQAMFHRSSADELRYGGAAGGGKSKAIVMEALIDALEHPGIHAYLFRRTYPELRDTLIREAITSIPSRLGKYNELRHDFRLINGSVLHFRFCRNLQDAYRYQGVEIHRLYIDELTHFSQDIYDYLKTRLRTVSSLGITPRIRCASNPGNIGHGWVKSLFIDGKEPYKLFTDTVSSSLLGKSREATRQYIPATVLDNPHLSEDYVFQLEQKPPALRKALLLGDWNVFEGQVFTEFVNDPAHYQDRIGTHVIAPFRIPKEWKRYRSFDWGYSKPFSVGYWAADNDGRLYRYHEIYGSPIDPATRLTARANVGMQLEPAAVAAQIREYEDTYEKDTHFIGIADPAVFDESRGSDGCISNIFAQQGIYFERGDHKRIAGKMQLHNRLAFNADGIPMLYVFENCADFIRTFPAIVYDKLNPEDIDSSGEDHIYDETRYLCMYLPIKVPEKPVSFLRDDPLDLSPKKTAPLNYLI